MSTNLMLYCEIAIISIIMLSVLLWSFKKTNFFDDKLFKALIIFTILETAIDGVCWILNGINIPAVRIVSIILIIAYDFLMPIICFIWFLFCDYKLFVKSNRIKRMIKLVSPFFFAYLLIIISSIWNGLIFNISTENIYSKGSLFILHSIVSYIFLAVATLNIILNLKNVKNKERKNELLALIAFAVLPAVCSIAQLFLTKLPLIWIGTSLSIMFIHITLQNRHIFTDSLTGVNNRARLSVYAKSKINNHKKDAYIYYLIMDIDYFKEINDTYGHSVGDQVLQRVGAILNSVCQEKQGIVSRYGGDEFAIIYETKKKEHIHRLIDTINHKIEESNARNNLVPISMSIGYSLLYEDGVCDYESMLDKADMRLYENKKKNHDKILENKKLLINKNIINKN